MKWSWLFIAALSVGAVPSFAFAQVVINEVMYNPSGSDTGREWVELYNEGQSDVTMVGGSGKGSWRLNDGSNHTLTDPAGGTGRGSLTVPAGGYLVIASDPSDFVSGEYAGGTYSVVKSSITLNNNGATITLLDGTGATVDTVSYLPSQGANDDGTSLQRQADGSWIAALPTPGTANSITPYVPPPPDDAATDVQPDASTTDQTQAQSSVTTPSYIPPPAPSLYADAGGDRTVIVGADVEFDGSAYDRTQTLLDPTTVRFLWNFGDGSTAEGNAVLHHFSYPGRYAVVLELANDKNAATDRVVVDAQPAALFFSLLPDGGVGIENLAGHDLDLSGWIVREDAGVFAHQFILPQDTELLSASSLRVSPQTLQFRASSSTMLEYPNGALAFAMGGSSATSAPDSLQIPSVQYVATPAATDRAPAQTPAVETPPDPSADTSNADDPTSSDATETDDAMLPVVATTTVIQTAAAASAPASAYLWWAGVAALALAAAAAIVAAAHFRKGEWNIVEETEE